MSSLEVWSQLCTTLSVVCSPKNLFHTQESKGLPVFWESDNFRQMSNQCEGNKKGVEHVGLRAEVPSGDGWSINISEDRVSWDSMAAWTNHTVRWVVTSWPLNCKWIQPIVCESAEAVTIRLGSSLCHDWSTKATLSFSRLLFIHLLLILFLHPFLSSQPLTLSPLWPLTLFILHSFATFSLSLNSYYLWFSFYSSSASFILLVINFLLYILLFVLFVSLFLFACHPLSSIFCFLSFHAPIIFLYPPPAPHAPPFLQPFLFLFFTLFFLFLFFSGPGRHPRLTIRLSCREFSSCVPFIYWVEEVLNISCCKGRESTPQSWGQPCLDCRGS